MSDLPEAGSVAACAVARTAAAQVDTGGARDRTAATISTPSMSWAAVDCCGMPPVALDNAVKSIEVE